MSMNSKVIPPPGPEPQATASHSIKSMPVVPKLDLELTLPNKTLASLPPSWSVSIFVKGPPLLKERPVNSSYSEKEQIKENVFGRRKLVESLSNQLSLMCSIPTMKYPSELLIMELPSVSTKSEWSVFLMAMQTRDLSPLGMPHSTHPKNVMRLVMLLPDLLANNVTSLFSEQVGPLEAVGGSMDLVQSTPLVCLMISIL
jgi:hypothetical protein